MIELTGLSVSIQDTLLLEDIDLQLHQGQYLVVVGPNGSGKSTLLKTLVGIIGQYSGEIRYRDRKLALYSQRELARLVSYVPQSSGRELPFAVEDFIKMSRYAHHTALSDWEPEDQQAVDDALRITDTASFRQRQMTTLSGGESQRVMIAGAL